MNILRKIAVSFCATILAVALLGVAWSHVGVATIRNRETVKNWLSNSKFYERIPDIALEALKKESEKKKEGIGLPLDDPQIKTIIKKAFNVGLLRDNIETVLDGSYSWLDGTNNKLDFQLDFSKAKTQLAKGLGEYVAEKTASLPVCTSSEPGGDFDAFSAKCRPAALSADAAGENVKKELLRSDFLEDAVISAKDLKVKGEDGKEVPLSEARQIQAARQLYTFGGYAPLMLGVIALLTAAGVVLISKDRLKGLRRAGNVLITCGVILLITVLVLNALQKAGIKSIEAGDNVASHKQLFIDAGRVIAQDVKAVLVPYTAGYILGGIGLILGSRTLRGRRDGKPKQPETGLKPESPEDSTNDSELEKEKPSNSSTDTSKDGSNK